MKKKYVGLFILVVGIFFSVLIVWKGTKVPKEGSAVQYKEALFYRKLGDGKVQCELCPNRCTLNPGQRGICGVRKNIDGNLYSLVYGRPVTTHVDPIEKKPLYHFLPGSKVYSLATVGCNQGCKYCQNWDIAHRAPEDVEAKDMSPEEVVNAAVESGAKVIAFTYNEPTVWYEYMLDIAKLAKERGLRTVNITSGYINQEPLEELLPYLDAVKIDLKAFDERTYQTLIQGHLQPVLNSIETVEESGTWLEIVNLVVPGYTDDLEEIERMCSWVKKEVGADVPLHFSRFHPAYKLTNLPPTPKETLIKAREVCLAVGLNYVYVGNIDTETGSTTFCPVNEEPVLIRDGYFIKDNKIDTSGAASNCPQTIPGVWE